MIKIVQKIAIYKEDSEEEGGELEISKTALDFNDIVYFEEDNYFENYGYKDCIHLHLKEGLSFIMIANFNSFYKIWKTFKESQKNIIFAKYNN